jgi:hypothetical protein
VSESNGYDVTCPRARALVLSAPFEREAGRTIDGGGGGNGGILRGATLGEDGCTAEIIHGLPGIQNGIPFLVPLGCAFLYVSIPSLRG